MTIVGHHFSFAEIVISACVVASAILCTSIIVYISKRNL